MAKKNEQVEEQQPAPVPAEEQAAEDVNVSGVVTTGAGPDNERHKIIAMEEKNKDLFKKFNCENYQQFMTMVGSDGHLAQRVVNYFLLEKEGESAPVALEAQSPQESNVTGKVDHTGDVGVRIKEGVAADNKPPAA